MQKKTLFYFCLSALCSTLLQGEGHIDRGFYGSLDFLYQQDDYTMGSSNTVEEKFIKELNLGYGGNIYSPLLLEYTVEAALRFEDRETTTQDDAVKEKTEGVDYKTKFDFIKKTKFPFSVYANKSERPVNTVYSVYTQEYINETKNEGVTGKINFSPYIVTYGATTTKNTTESHKSIQNSQTSTYQSAFKYKNKIHDFGADYSHYIEENTQHYITDAIRSLDRERDVVNLSYAWLGSEDLAVTSGAGYEKDKYFSSETINADFNTFWRPKGEKYDASFSMYGSKMELEPTQESAGYVFNTVNMNQAFNYKLTENINLSESAMLYIYDATTVKGTSSSINLYGTHNYTKTFFENIPFNLTTSLGVQKNDSNSKSTTDINGTTTSSNIEKYSLNINARAKREFPSIKSTLNANSSYYNSIGSNDEEEQRYDFGLFFLSRIFSIVNNNLSARYFQSERTTISIIDEEKTQNEYTETRIMDTIDFNFNLGIRGKIGFKVGAEYTNRENNGEVTSDVSPRGEINMNYRLFTRWQFAASARVSEMYNTLENSGTANLTFRAGKTTFLMGYQYNKSEIESVLTTLNNERSIFKVQFTRTF